MKCLNSRHAALFAAMEDAGVVAEVFVFEQQTGRNEADYIREAFRLLDLQLEQYAKEAAKEGLSEADFFRIDWYHENLVGKPVTWAALLGSENAKPEKLGASAWSIPKVDGLETAFLYPPMGALGESLQARERLYQQFMAEVVGRREDVSVQQWNTDACNYFDAGHEWWGSFLWTVHNRVRGEVVVIALSATD